MIRVLSSKASSVARSAAKVEAGKLPRVGMLIIDPQVDFHPGGSLAIPNANDDAARNAALIRQKCSEISDIFITLDSHHRSHVAHAISWIDGQGRHPSPFQIITAADVLAGRWTAADKARRKAFKKYVVDLEASNKFKLTIWPEHCLIGTPGHAVVPSINEAAQDWVRKTMTTTRNYYGMWS
jgi:nicotinamidase/pyrazinamidase